MKTVLAAAAALGLLSAPQIANAGDTSTVTISVSSEGLDLTRPDDVRRLRNRVADAAAAACDPADRMIVTPLPDVQCRREAIASVEPAIKRMAQAAHRTAPAHSR